MIWKEGAVMEERRFVEASYQGMTVREQKMLRALHMVHRDHDFTPATCDGCLEAAAFGYGGSSHPLTN
jgi:hypothetical protein